MNSNQDKFSQFDLSKLSKVCRNRDALMKEMLELFLAHSPETIELIEKGSVGNHNEKITQYCHKLKGSIVNFAANGLCEKFQALEALSKSGQWEQFHELYTG